MSHKKDEHIENNKAPLISKSSRFKCEKCECDYSTKVQKLLRFTKKEVVQSCERPHRKRVLARSGSG